MSLFKQNFIKLIASILASIIITLGVIVIIGWYTKNIILLQVLPNAVPMQYNTALGFLLSGISILLAILSKSKLSSLLGIFIFILGFLTLNEYIFNINLYIDELFMEHYIMDKVSHKGRMAPNTATCFTLTGIILIIQGNWNSDKKSPAIGTLALLIISLGTIAFTSYFTEFDAVSIYGHLTQMAIHTTIGFIIIGIAFIIGLWYPFLGEEWIKSSISRKLSFYIIIPILIVYLVLAIFIIHKVKESTYKQAKINLREVGWKNTGIINSKLHEYEEVARSTRRFLLTQSDLKVEEINNELFNNLNSMHSIQGTAIVFTPYAYRKNERLYAPYAYRKNGKINLIDIGTDQYDYTDGKHSWYETTKKIKKGIWSEPYFDNKIESTWIVTYSIPVYKNGGFWAIVIIDIPLLNIYKVFESNQLDKFKYGIISKKGNYIYSSINQQYIGQNAYTNSSSQIMQEGDKKELLDLMLKGEEGFKEVDLKGGDSFHTTFNPIFNSGWSFFIGLNRSQILKPVKQTTLQVALLFIIVLLLFILIIYGVSAKLSTRILLLNEASNQIAKGNLNTPIIIKENDEIGLLSKNFSLMTKQLKYRENELHKLNNNLESKVKERTTQLEKAVLDLEKNQQILKQNEDKFKTLFNSTSVPFCYVDPKGTIELINDEFSKTFGYSQIDLPNLNSWWKIAFPDPKYREWVLKTWSKAVNDAQEKDSNIKSIAYNVTCKNGESRTFIIGGAVFENNYFLATFYDITDLKLTEKKLKEAKDAADEANKAKSIFLANMSHEIRTPMNSILGFSELLEKIVQTNIELNYVKSIRSSGKNLLALINDILDISKIEAGKVSIDYTFFNIRNLLEELKNSFSLKVQEKKLQFNLAVDKDIPRNIFCDEFRFRQILINLINNAIKFTSKGYINVKVKLIYSDKEQRNSLQINVEDSGIGIEESFIKNLFQSFTQQDGKITKQYGGTGLGLAISKNLAEMMNGEITVKSQIGIGSTFSLILNTLEFSDYNDIEVEEIDTIRFKFEEATILVVDDVKDNRKYILGALREYNFNTIEAHNGQEALSILNNTKVDLILTDLRMPVMDGFSLMECISKNQKFKNMPVIATSASVLELNQSKTKNYKFRDFLAKPIKVNELINSLVKFLPFQKVSSTNYKIEETLNDIELGQNAKEKLIEQLEKLLIFHQKFNEQQAMDDINYFSQQLHLIGEKYKLIAIQEYSTSLNNAINSFDIETMLLLINNFPDFVHKLKE